MEQAPSRGHGASPQGGLCVGCKLFSSGRKPRGLSVRESLTFVASYLKFLSRVVFLSSKDGGHLALFRLPPLM